MSNQPKGTPIRVNRSVDKKYCEYRIQKVLLAIFKRFLFSYLDKQNRRGVLIQQDGAKSHITLKDSDWMAAVQATGRHITIHNQPANSPDTNINDLAFSHLFSHYYNESPLDEWQLIAACF